MSITTGLKRARATLSDLRSHPLVEGDRLGLYFRYVKFQVLHRLLPGPALYPFVGELKYLAELGGGLIPGNIYVGLHDHEEMLFLAHLLRRGDLFVDIGANVGVYSLFAGGFLGARVVAVEPMPDTFLRLGVHLKLNRLEGAVRAENVGLGSEPSTLRFAATANSAWSHVLADGEDGSDSVEVPVTTADALLAGEVPVAIKIDVEGFEKQVFAGASATLRDPTLQAILVELNGSGAKYGSSDQDVDAVLRGYGFEPFLYDPFRRTLAATQIGGNAVNVIYVRGIEAVQAKVEAAEKIRIGSRRI